jgi:hypothetical protein
VETRGRRYQELKIPERTASAAIFSSKEPWRLSTSSALQRPFANARFKALGLLSMEKLAAA